MYKNKKGFTMVELVVTLLIIITLSLLSFPLYEGRNTDKSKLAEGYALLGTIINAQIAYYNEYGNFLTSKESGYSWTSNASANFTNNDPVLGINATNNRYFTYFNPFGLAVNVNGDGHGHFKYHFKGIVKSAKAGTVSLEYNLTQKFEPEVAGI